MHDRLFSGLRFTAAAKVVVQISTWLGTLYVLRELDSRALGLFGIASVVLGYATLVYEGGLLEALVQRPPQAEGQRAAVSSFLLLSGFALAIVMAALAPLVGLLVEDSSVVPLMLVLAFSLLITPMSILPQAQLMHDMRFGSLALVSSVQAMLTTLITVGLVMYDYGAWALVLGYVAGIVVRTAMFMFLQPMKSPLTLNLAPARSYVNIGGILIADGLLWRWYTSLDTLLLGRWVGTTALGNFSFAQQVAHMPLEKISTVVNDISLPAYVALESNPAEARRLMLETLRTHAVIGFPMFWGMAAVAEPAIITVFGAKWLPATSAFIALSLIAPLRLMGSIETPAMTGIGRPKVLLLSKAIVVPVMTAAIAIGAWYGGVNGVALAWLLAFPLSYGIAFRFVLHAIGLNYGHVLAATRGPVLASLGMCAVVQGLLFYLDTMNPAVQLAAGVMVGGGTFVLLLYWLDRKGFQMTLERIRRLAGFAPKDAA